VVDDIAVNRRLAEQLLRKLGFAPELAESGDQAIRLVQDQPVDLIFMDVQMPGMDGQATTRAIRKLPHLSRQPWIVAMTAHARNEDREACLAAGMNDFLSKPVARADLAHAIDRCQGEPGWGESLAGSSAPGSAAAIPWQVIDASAWEELRTLLGDEEEAGLTELIDLFLEDAPEQVAAVTAAAESRQAEAMIRAVHSLRSPAASLGAKRLATLCGDVENALRSTAGSWPQERIDGVILEAERACEALRQLRPSNG
jgi:CheY-like chemotaxis protein